MSPICEDYFIWAGFKLNRNLLLVNMILRFEVAN